jgi:corrinoid protein of di/trimethylamine methyltransferase
MDSQKLVKSQRQAILAGDTERAVELAHEALATGADVIACIEEGYVAGIREVGRLWEEGEYFLPELVQGAEAMKAAMTVLRPEVLKLGVRYEQPPRVVLGTVKGDIHDIGKSLVGTVLEANGFEVVDLGRDVSDEAFVDAVGSSGARILGLSALLTTTMSRQGRVISLLKERGLRDGVVVLVGGAPVTRRFADEIGADGYAANAMAALAEVRRLLGEKR